ncbi:succinyl-diaminopimelate desuccinylase [Bifidobacterium sp.]|uniref:succinyl-diaminopimelate desuccinylase n=1 Tax=Bifidobacterium sp. TaxID=41200 RepID=UPI0039E76E37
MPTDSIECHMHASEHEQLDELFESIMGMYSVSGSEHALADAVERFLRGLAHLEVHRLGDTLVASTHLNRASRVVLAGHLDTVPVIDNFPPRWLHPGDPLIRKEIAEAYPSSAVMWGRGSADMKASDAVMLYLAASLTDTRHDLTFVFYDHEEVAAEHNGLRKVAEKHPDWIRADFAIIGEPTSCAIEGGCNGTMRFDVITHGIAAHSARAWMGRNAIHEAGDILNRLNAFEARKFIVDGLEYQEGLNATMISGGSGTNVIPEECRVHVNYRFAPDKTVEEAKSLMFGEESGIVLGSDETRAPGGIFAGYGILMCDESPAARPGMDSPLSQSLSELVERRTGQEPRAKMGWTDVARFSQIGTPAVNLGAGNPLLAHKHDEQVPVDDLYVMADILKEWLS